MKKSQEAESVKTLTTSEAARLVGCAEITIRQWVRRGKLMPIARIGRYMVFARSHIEYLRSHFGGKK